MSFELDVDYLEVQREARELAASVESIATEADASNVIHPSDPGATLQHSSMAKLAASEMASRVVDRCVQMEKLYRQARPMRVYEGASEVLRLGIARQLTEEVS